MKLLSMLLMFAVLATGQDADPGKKKAEEKKPAPEKRPTTLKPLKPGEVRILKAIVLDVKGIAQARRPVKKAKDAPKPKWKKLKVNDVLQPGVVVRTGRKSRVTLRIGANATMLIDRQTRVKIPEIVQKGKVLRTRVSMAFGRADVKVDRIGLDNDFEVATPTATLAVRGTVFRIWWDIVNGFRALGVPGNKIRAIEVRYVNAIKAFLSKADSTDENFTLPAISAFQSTYLEPLIGALSQGEQHDPTQDPAFENPSNTDDNLAASKKHRGGNLGRGDGAQPIPPGAGQPPGGPTTGTPPPPPQKQKQKDK